MRLSKLKPEKGGISASRSRFPEGNDRQKGKVGSCFAEFGPTSASPRDEDPSLGTLVARCGAPLFVVGEGGPAVRVKFALLTSHGGLPPTTVCIRAGQGKKGTDWAHRSVCRD